MGVIRFHLPESDRIVRERAAMIYMAGMDTTPMKGELRVQGDLASLERESNESGKVFFPFRTDDDYVLLIPTGTVIEREQPYRSLLELARGTVDRLRNQHELWMRYGFEFSTSINEGVREVSLLFCRAIVRQGQEAACDQLAENVINRAIRLTIQMSGQYSQQVIEMRRDNSSRLPTLIGYTDADSVPAGLADDDGSVDEATPHGFEDPFNSVHVDISWRECEPQEGTYEFSAIIDRIASLRAQQKRVLLGPCIRIDERSLPEFILNATEFDFVRQKVAAFVDALIQATQESVDIVEVFGGLNSAGDFVLPVDYQLRLAIDAIESARRAHKTLPILIGFDQPWNEASNRNDSINPLQCADAVVRANLELSGFLVEINWGLIPSGTAPRDLLQVHSMLDTWSQFELPLVVSMCIPSGIDDDPLARSVDAYVTTCPKDEAPKRQAEILDQLMELLLAKPYVQGIVWNQISDACQHQYRFGGLFDADGEPKPAIAVLGDYRAKYLS